MSKRQRNVSPISGSSASQTSGSMMNTGISNGGVSQTSSKSAKTAESGGSVGFSNGNIKRLGQSQSNSASYKSAASSLRNQKRRKVSPMNTGSSNNEVTQPSSKKPELNLLRQRILKSAKQEKAEQIQKRRAQQLKNMNAQRRANEKARAMKQIREKIEAKEKEKARLKALTNEAERQRVEAQRQKAKKNAENKKAKITEYIKSANLFPAQKSFFLNEIEIIPQNNFNILKRMINKSVNDKKRLNKATGATANKAAANKATANKAAANKAAANKAAENAKKAEPKSIKQSVGTKRQRSASPNAPSSKKPRTDRDELVKMKLPELKELARKRGIKSISKIKKQDLVELLLAAKNKPNTVKNKPNTVKNKPNSPKNQETLKTFVTKTPAKRKMSATPVLGNNTQSKKMLVTKGLLEVYMDKITKSKRKYFTNEKQKEVLDYMVRRNLSSGPMPVERTISPKTFINMLLIMWLDGVHDKYITTTFKEWLTAYKDVFAPENYESDQYFQELQRASLVERSQNKNSVRKVYILDGNRMVNILNGAISATIAIELAETPGKKIFFAKTFINNLGFKGQSFTGFSAGWEKYFKTIVLNKYTGLKKVNTIINPRDYNIKSRTGADRILLAVDQEYSGREERSLSGMISGSDSVSPLITYGQAFDPGSTMLPFGIVKDIEKIAILTRTNTGSVTETKPRFVSDASYYLEDFNITIKSNKKAVIKIEFDSGRKTGKSNLKLNDIPLDLNVSAGNAKKKEGVVDKIGKYFGDALQYFIASQLTNTSEKNRTKKIRNGGSRTYHYFLGSGDGMALFGYDFVCTEIFRNSAPNMVVDYSEGSVPIAHIINMDNTKFVLPEKEPVPSRSDVITGSYMTRANNTGPNNGGEVTGPSRA